MPFPSHAASHKGTAAMHCLMHYGCPHTNLSYHRRSYSPTCTHIYTITIYIHIFTIVSTTHSRIQAAGLCFSLNSGDHGDHGDHGDRGGDDGARGSTRPEAEGSKP